MRGIWSHPHSFHVAGVVLTALGGLWWRTGFSADAVGAVALCVAGVALGHIHIRFTDRPGAWRHPPSFRGRRGTWSHPHSFHLASVALTSLGGLWWRTGFSADAVDAAALCVAGVALGDIHLNSAWQAWHFVTIDRHFAWQGWRIYVRFAWQAWHLWLWAGSHTIFDTPLCHTPSFTHHFVTHHLSHHFFTHHLSHTIFHTPLCHTPSFTHHLSHTQLCHTHHLSHHFFTHHLSHTTLSHSMFQPTG